MTSFDVLYSLEQPDEQAAVAEMFRLTRPGGHVLINVAAMDVLRGDHSVLSHEVRRYNRDTLAPARDERRLRPSSGSRTRTPRCFCRWPPSATLHRRRGLAREADAQREISVPASPVNAAMSAVLFLESLWLRRFDSPFGSSLLCLARKPQT